MKLSKAQQAVIDKAKKDIDFARNSSFSDWHQKAFRCTPEEEDAHLRRVGNEKDVEWHRNWSTKRFEEEKAGIVLTMCNSRTLAKLSELGLIEIIQDSNGQHYGIDTVKVLNY